MYINDILEAALKPWAVNHFIERIGYFNRTPHPLTKPVTQECLRNHVPKIISPEEWPASSPDLNPMDFSIWSILEAKVCTKAYRSVDSLKSSLQKEWVLIDENVLRAVTDNFYKVVITPQNYKPWIGRGSLSHGSRMK